VRTHVEYLHDPARNLRWRGSGGASRLQCLVARALVARLVGRVEMKFPRVVMFDDQTILHIAEDGTITLEPDVTAEQLAKLLVEAMDQATLWRERAASHVEMMRTFDELLK